jgi:hypothetical protein
MRIPTAALVALLVFPGCGGDDESALQGIYELASWTSNPDSCDVEGPPSFEASAYSHFFVRQDEFFGETFVSAVMCADLEECRTNAAETDTLFLGQFSFDEGSDDSGWTGWNASGIPSDDGCDAMVNLGRLTGEPGVSVTIRQEGRPVTGVPLDGEGDCDLDVAHERAEDASCEQLVVVTGSFFESL